MSSNRLKYDTCAYATTIKESTEPLEYWLYKGKYETCTTCSNANFTNNIEFSSRADVESELYGLTRPGTDCPSLKYDPTKSFNNPYLSPPIICQSIYGLTPSNLVNPTTNMLNENNLGINLCSIKPNTNVIEKFTSTEPIDCSTDYNAKIYTGTNGICYYKQPNIIVSPVYCPTVYAAKIYTGSDGKCYRKKEENDHCTASSQCKSNYCNRTGPGSTTGKCYMHCGSTWHCVDKL